MKNLSLVILVLQLMCSCNSATSPQSETNIVNESTPDTLAFVISEGNNIIFKAILDKKDTLDFYFDTGGTELVLKHSTIQEKTSLLRGRNENYAEENYVPLVGTYALSLGNLSWIA